ncbi:S8 family peptidase [Aquabacterium sp.]|uniref:S8 family peptidase n=1 Tax=Aquabacterium sp. TaxID=1872578 RepID=UPI003784C8D5
MSRRPHLPTSARLALALLAAACGSAFAAGPRQLSEDPGTDRLIVKYRNTATIASVTASGSANNAPATAAPAVGALSLRSSLALRVAANRHGVQMNAFRQTANGAHVFAISRRMSTAEAEALAASLKAGDASIEYAEPDRILQALSTPNDPQYSSQWHWSDTTGGVRAPAAWDVSTGSGVTVAVIDTGVRPHPDLAANLLPGYDFITSATTANDGGGRDSDASDPGDGVAAGFCGSGSSASNSSWHGTHVSGIIAAVGNNATGVTGLAYNAKILPLRALGRCGGYTSDIADAITWAAGGSVGGVPANTTPAKVLNLSLGGTGSCDTTSQAAINSARAAGAVVIVAAGNANTNASNTSPANCNGVITVASTGISGGRASYSNYGSVVTLAAPGGDSGNAILSTLNAGTGAPGADSYGYEMGTSMATPVVAGVAALMLSVNNTLTPDQVKQMMVSTVRSFPATCSQCGAGLIDAAAAVTAAHDAITPAPITVTEAESNDTLATAQAVASVPATVNGGIGSNGDVDYYRISVPASKTLTITLTGAAGTGPGLGVYTALGRKLVEKAGSTGQALSWSLANRGSGALTLYVRVSKSAGSTGNYALVMGI